MDRQLEEQRKKPYAQRLAEDRQKNKEAAQSLIEAYQDEVPANGVAMIDDDDFVEYDPKKPTTYSHLYE